MVPPRCQKHRCTHLLVQGAHTCLCKVHTQGRSAHRLSPSLACHEATIIQSELRVKNTQDTAMIRASSFPRSAWCFGDRETQTGPQFRHMMTRPPREQRAVVGRESQSPELRLRWRGRRSCAGEPDGHRTPGQTSCVRRAGVGAQATGPRAG